MNKKPSTVYIQLFISADETSSIRSPGKNYAVASTSSTTSSSKVVSKSGSGNIATTATSQTAKSLTAQSQSAYSETRSYTSAKAGNYGRATSPSKQKIQEKSLALNKGSTSPKLPSYRGTAEKCKFEGETVRHFNAGKLAIFELR